MKKELKNKALKDESLDDVSDDPWLGVVGAFLASFSVVLLLSVAEQGQKVNKGDVIAFLL